MPDTCNFNHLQWQSKLVAKVKSNSASKKAPKHGHGSYRFPNFLFKEFSRSFPGLLNNIQGVRFSRHSLNCVLIILHLLHSHVNKPLFLIQLHLYFHMKQNQMMLMSLAACFHCCFHVFHFSRVISTHSHPCLKRQ